MIILPILFALMGAVHVLGAIIRLLSGKEKYEGYRAKLISYLIIVILFFTILIFHENIFRLHDFISDDVFILFLFIIPWIIAAYYWSIIYHKSNDIIESPKSSRILHDSLLDPKANT